MMNSEVNTVQPRLVTVFYKYNRFAPLIILLYVLVFVVFFFISMDLSPWISAIGFGVLIIPPIYGAIRKRSVFNLRSWDSRRLTFTPTHIAIGEQQYDVSGLKIALFVNGFEGFSYSKNNKWISRNSIYGDRNFLSFRIDKRVDDYQFYLRDYKAYLALYEVVNAWKQNKVGLVVKEAFTPQFVREQMNQFIGTKKFPQGE